MARQNSTARASDAHRSEYERRVHRVVEHVRAHLADELSVPGLARVAAFSPFHFHRVFRAVTGETLLGFVHRLRIERAAVALRDRRHLSVLAVALDHGFSSPATFARAFRVRFGMSATEWRATGAERWRGRYRRRSKPGKPIRKAGKARGRRGADTRSMSAASMPVAVRPLPAFHLAGMHYVGPYGARGIPELWARLRTWMATRDLTMAATTRLGIAYDDPTVTAPDKCRYDAGVVVPADFAGDRWVDLADLPAGRYAVASFAGSADEIESAWDQVFNRWLPGSGYQPDDRPCIEVYRGDPEMDAKGRFRCELCLPVRPL